MCPIRGELTRHKGEDGTSGSSPSMDTSLTCPLLPTAPISLTAINHTAAVSEEGPKVAKFFDR
jgi:hypothetical protein